MPPGRIRHARDFLLKGAMLFAAWTEVPHRATRDLDLLGTGQPDLARLQQVFRAIVTTNVEPDGVTFDVDSVQAARIREDQLYQGVRVTMTAALGSARIGVQVDAGFGDAVLLAPWNCSTHRCSACPPRDCSRTRASASSPRSSRPWSRSAN